MALLTRWDPFQDLAGLERGMGRLLADLGVPRVARRGAMPDVMLPSVDVITRGEDLLVRAELPGIKPDEIDISVTENVLTIRGERHEKTEVAEDDYQLREMYYGSFERSLRLPPDAETDKVHAEYGEGILEITIPKAAAKAPAVHKVPIETVATGAPEEHH